MSAAVRLHFVLGAGVSSRLIAWWGNGYGGFSHVDAVLADGTLAGARSDEVGGCPPGFQVRPAGYEQWRRTALVEIPATAGQAAQWEGWQRSQVNRQYDQAAIIGFLLGIPLHEAGHWICSAAQNEGLEQVNLLHARPVPDSQVSPNALFLLTTAGLGGKIVKTTG